MDFHDLEDPIRTLAHMSHIVCEWALDRSVKCYDRAQINRLHCGVAQLSEMAESLHKTYLATHANAEGGLTLPGGNGAASAAPFCF
jgi:hypothetical protein